MMSKRHLPPTRDTSGIFEAPLPSSRILAAVINELEFMMLGTALAGSLVTAHAMLRPLSPQYSVLSYLPPEPMLTSTPALALSGFDVTTDVRTSFNDFHAALEAAKTAVAAVARHQGAASSIGALWMTAGAQWRRAASAAVAAGDNFSRGFADGMRDFMPQWHELRALLAKVADGMSPCVTSTGHIEFPSWADRRRDQRIPISIKGWHHVREQRRSVTVVDISSAGFGLSGGSDIAAGDTVAIEIASGRLLSGVAMWVRGDRTGVRFRAPLSGSDVLLA